MKNLSQINDNKDIITKEYLVAGYEPLLPATPLEPTTKYLNGLRQWSTIAISNIDNLQTTLDGKLNLTGGTLNGKLKTDQTSANDADDVVATKKYVDDNAGKETKTITSATEPNLNTGDQWHKEI